MNALNGKILTASAVILVGAGATLGLLLVGPLATSAPATAEHVNQPIVVPYTGSGCSTPDAGLHAYLPDANGLANRSKVLTCNGHNWVS